MTRGSLIIALAALYIVGQRGVERLRLAASEGGPRQDVLAVWTVLSALVLPPLHMAVVIAAVYGLVLPSFRGIAPRRVLINLATTVVASEAGGWIYHQLHPGLGALTLGAAAIVLAQPALVAMTMLAAGQADLIGTWFRSPTAWTINLSTAAVGTLFAWTLVDRLWFVLPVLMAATWVLQWAAQHLQVTRDRALDPATGLPTEAVWRRLVAQLPADQGWTIVSLQPVDPSRLDATADVVQLMADQHEVVGRYGHGIATVVKASPLIARNLVGRLHGDLAAIGIHTDTRTGAGGTLAEQLDALDRDTARAGS